MFLCHPPLFMFLLDSDDSVRLKSKAQHQRVSLKKGHVGIVSLNISEQLSLGTRFLLKIKRYR